MWVGDVIDDRFVIERPVASGGMGAVFFAADRALADRLPSRCFITLLARRADRFWREARLLSELAHPSIVKYIAHGETPEYEPFLVMEWLEGEDLRARLASRPLTLDEALASPAGWPTAWRTRTRAGSSTAT